MFVQFLNDQILNLYGLPQRLGTAMLGSRVRRLLWSAALISEDPLVVPTVDLIQSPVGNVVMDLVQGLSAEGLVELVGSTTDLDDFLRRKRIHFHDTGLHPEWSSAKAPKLLEGVRGSLNARTINTTQDMFDQWVTSVTNIADTDFLRRTDPRPIAERQLLQAYQQLPVEPSFLKFVDKAYELPGRLGDHAFLWNVVQSVDAFRLPVPAQVVAPFERALAFYWTYSHLREYRTSLIGHDLVVGWIDCGIRYDEPDAVFDLAAFTRMLRMIGLEGILTPSNADDLLALKLDAVAIAAISGVLLPWFADVSRHSWRRDEILSRLRSLSSLLREAGYRQFDSTQLQRVFETILAVADMSHSPQPSDVRRASAPSRASQAGNIGRDTVFIGHGQSLIWVQLRDLLTERLGLHFEEFNRVPVAGRTVTDRLRQMLEASDFAFIVLTGEDETADGVLRARQNVVHELGLFQGRLGFDRSIILLEQECEEFSNIAGLQVIRFPRNNIMAISEEIRRVLEERL
jgi:predicted nucleotide-binding protein